ncbi:hypothetical protein SVIOM342S_09279 [Streptomyces violaceorubidus]
MAMPRTRHARARTVISMTRWPSWKKVVGKAKRLAEEHEEKAGYRARKIRDATKKLVPHEPGWFDEALDWLGDNLPDILSFVAGLIGVVALLFAGPLGLATVAALMLTASALSATALGLRLGDAEVRASLMRRDHRRGARRGFLE